MLKKVMMKINIRFSYIKYAASLFVLIGVQLNISACSLLEIKEQAQKTESSGVIKGRILLDTSKSGPVSVHRYYLKNNTYVTDSFIHTNSDGEYQFYTLPGTYYIAAFVDSNEDGEYQDNEDADFYSVENGKPTPVVVKPKETVTVATITISGTPPELSKRYTSEDALEKSVQNIGKLTSLNDPMFTQSNNSMGMWKPLQFLEQVGGGLFLLQKYQHNKIPVLFVHGMNGGPLDWKEAISGLDREYFQPWIIYYPSGLRVDMISDYMVQAISYLQRKHEFKRIFIVAHSLGGLVAGSSIKLYRQRYPDLADSIDLLVTVNTPLGGMESAAMGVKNSPIVLPVWRDLDPDSKFLHDLSAWFFPEDIPYYLFFSYMSGSGDDGIVPLQSQIPYKIQQNAAKIYGFNNTHLGTLKDGIFLNLFNAILAERLENSVK